MIKRANNKRYILLIYLMLAIAVITAYEPMRHNDFINYDDPVYVTKNPHITGGLTAKSIIWAFTSPHSYMYHPLTTLSHMLDCELFGLEPFWHHAVSLLLHTLSTLLLFWLLKRETCAVWASAFVAAVFALHPLQVDSVAWASERKNILSGFFWISTMAAYVHYAERPRVGRYLLVVILYALALLSKPVVVTLPFALLLLDYWPMRRLRHKAGKDTDSEKLRHKQFSAARLVMEKLPLFVLSAILSVITFLAQRGGGIVLPLAEGPVKYRLANAFIAYLKYIEKFIWPSKLAVFYPHPGKTVSIGASAACALALVLLTGIFIYLARRRRYPAVGWLWFVGTLVPVIGVIQVGSQAMADRYMYIPIIGLAIIIAWGVRDITEKLKYRTILVTLSALVVLSAAVICTRRQVGHWRNSLTIWEHASNVTEGNSVMYSNYGHALYDNGQLDEALIKLKKAVEIDPTIARTTLGMIYMKKGCLDLAVSNWNRALELKPDSSVVLNNLAWVLAATKDDTVRNPAKAVEYALRACELTDYEAPDLLDTLAVAYAAAGRFPDAVKTAEQAIDLALLDNQKTLADQIQERLVLYQANKPYYDK